MSPHPSSAIQYPGLSAAEVHHSEDNRYLLLTGGRAFQIGAAVYEVVRGLQRGQDLDEACAAYEQQHHTRLRMDELKALLLKYLGAPTQSAIASRSSYIYCQIPLLKGSVLTTLGRPFVGMFHTAVLGPLLAVVALLLAGFVLKQGWFVPQVHSLPALQTTLLAYVGVIVGIFFHEMGHSVAALRYGMRPKGIGFGFYLIFPVFFADVTDVWVLSKAKRIVINLGGVYFQGLFSLALIGAYYALPAAYAGSRELLGTIVTMNLFVMLYSLNPFLRNDGYWVYSDLFGIPNLMHRAVLYPLRFVRRGGVPVAPFRLAELPLLVYATANYVLFVYLVRLFGHYSSHTLLPRLQGLLSASDFWGNLLTWPNSLFLLKTFGLYGFMLYMTLYTFWRNYRNYVKSKAPATSAAASSVSVPMPQAALA